MIRYALKCAQSHSFESWFRSADAFDALLGAGHLTCPECGTTDVRKSLMAPPVTTARQKFTQTATDAPTQDLQSDAQPEAAEIDQTSPSALPANNAPSEHNPALDPAQAQVPATTQQDIETSIAKMRDHVEQNSDYVGDDFTAQARAMNDGDAPARSIYGEAKLEDAKALIEEGVPVIPLPFAPKRKLN